MSFDPPFPPPRSKFQALRGLGLSAVLTLSFLYFYQAHYEVPILMYHHVDKAAEKFGNTVSPETFERQMEFLKVHRYQVISLHELVEKIRSGETLPAKAVAITFDDGNLDNMENAFPVLKRMGFPATVFMITSNIDQEGSLSEEDLKILDGSGITIGSHTDHHAFLPERDSSFVMTELTESKKKLEKVLGHPVDLLSYPAGGVTSEVRSLVQKAGYVGAVTTNYGRERKDPYALHRIKISEAKGSLWNFWAKLSGIYLVGKKKIKMLGEATG